MKAEGKRAYRSTGAVYKFDWIRRESINDLFGSVEEFVIGSSVEVALPTKGKGAVIWDNSSRCIRSNLAYRLNDTAKSRLRLNRHEKTAIAQVIVPRDIFRAARHSREAGVHAHLTSRVRSALIHSSNSSGFRYTIVEG